MPTCQCIPHGHSEPAHASFLSFAQSANNQHRHTTEKKHSPPRTSSTSLREYAGNKSCLMNHGSLTFALAKGSIGNLGLKTSFCGERTRWGDLRDALGMVVRGDGGQTQRTGMFRDKRQERGLVVISSPLFSASPASLSVPPVRLSARPSLPPVSCQRRLSPLFLCSTLRTYSTLRSFLAAHTHPIAASPISRKHSHTGISLSMTTFSSTASPSDPPPVEVAIATPSLPP